MGQQPQPAGRETSGHEAGTGGQSASFSAEHGAQCHGWEALMALATWMASRSRNGQGRTAGVSGMSGQRRLSVSCWMLLIQEWRSRS